ncbi:hypothetical protein [Gottfriedia acidiceleris]|uniref:hypothetical protein n=1 Tax=Gottfriedia acidiceleris TaxID=371036 RepID=UPI002FFE5918
MRYLLKIVFAIILSAPIAVLIWTIFTYFVSPDFFREENLANRGYFPFFTFIYIIIYFILGIPTTLIADFVTKSKIFANSVKNQYFVQLGIYTLAAICITSFDFSEGVTGFIPVLIPVYTYLHILLFLRRNPKNAIYSENTKSSLND